MGSLARKLWCRHIFKRFQAAKQVLLGGKFYVPVVGRGVEIIGELQEIPINLSIMRADDFAIVVFDRPNTKQIDSVRVVVILGWLAGMGTALFI